MRFFVCSILLLLVLIAFYCLDDGVHVVFWQINLLFRQFYHAFFISKNVPVSYCILATCQAHSQYLCYWCWKNAVVFSLTFRRTKQKFGCCLRKIVPLWHNNRSHFPFFLLLMEFFFCEWKCSEMCFLQFFYETKQKLSKSRDQTVNETSFEYSKFALKISLNLGRCIKIVLLQHKHASIDKI